MTLGATRIKTEHMDAKIVQPVDMPDLGFPIARPVGAVNMLHHRLYQVVVVVQPGAIKVQTWLRTIGARVVTRDSLLDPQRSLCVVHV